MTVTPELRKAIDHVVTCTGPDATGVAKSYPAFAQYARLLADAVLTGREWRPIETAPKDGTSVLLFTTDQTTRKPWVVLVRWTCAAHGFSSKPHQLHDKAECEYCWVGEMGSRYKANFTHWQPLPPPPKGDHE